MLLKKTVEVSVCAIFQYYTRYSKNLKDCFPRKWGIHIKKIIFKL
uniref:Uncharacterized protein n=1 Tax=Arundo donax TaxID=35708 RepID=A0A0A9DE83_ARUDO